MTRSGAPAAPPLRRIPFGAILAGCFVVWAITRWLQIKWVGLGFGFDVGLYQQYGQSWGSGQTPYVDFHPEYPPGALYVFLAPWMFGGARGYAENFAIEMAGFDLAALALVAAWADKLHPRRVFAAPLLALVYLLATAALYPVLYTRFDLVPGALVLAAVYFTYRPRRAWFGALLLGVAVLVKLWPLALAPLFCGVALRRRGWRGVIATSLWLAAGVLVPAAGIIANAHGHVLDFLEYHAARGIQIESTWATATLAAHALHLADAIPTHEYGAFHVRGALGDFFASVSTKATILLALLPQIVAFFWGGLGRRGDERGAVGLRTAAGTVLGFMVAGKVLSPQYMLWLVPLLVPALRGPLAVVALLATATLTTVVYPYLSPALELLADGHRQALLAVGGRNGLLLAFYVATLASVRKVRGVEPGPADGKIARRAGPLVLIWQRMAAAPILNTAYQRLEARARNLLFLDRAERTVKAFGSAQQVAVRRYYNAGMRRASVADELSDDRSAVAALVLYREAAAPFIAAIALSHDADANVEELLAGSAWTALETLASSGKIAALPPSVQDARRILTQTGGLSLDAYSTAALLANRATVESAIKWLREIVEPRTLREIRVSRLLRVTFASVAVVVALAWLVWGLVRPTNVALHKPATLSARHPASTAPADNSGFTNGQIESSYGIHTTTGGAWVMVDLINVYKLSKIKIYNRGDGWQDEGLPFSLDFSDDGTNFTEVGHRSETFGNTTPWVFDAGGQSTRYIRIRSNSYISLSELEAFGKK